MNHNIRHDVFSAMRHESSLSMATEIDSHAIGSFKETSVSIRIFLTIGPTTYVENSSYIIMQIRELPTQN